MGRKFEGNKLINLSESKNIKLINRLFYSQELVEGFDPDKKVRDKQINLKKYRFFIPKWDKIPMGLCVFYPFKDKSCVAHVGFKKKYRGKKAYMASKLIIEELLKSFKSIWAQIKKDNKNSLLYALQIGFKIKGEADGFTILEVIQNG